MMTNQQKRIFHKNALLISRYQPDDFLTTTRAGFNPRILQQAKKIIVKTRELFFGSAS